MKKQKIDKISFIIIMFIMSKVDIFKFLFQLIPVGSLACRKFTAKQSSKESKMNLSVCMKSVPTYICHGVNVQ